MAVMLAMMVGLLAGTAFARASDNASCQGQDLSFLARKNPNTANLPSVLSVATN